MYEFEPKDKMQTKGFKFLCLSFIISFSLIAYHNLDIGFVMSSDSYAYSKFADDLIKLDFNLFSFYDQSNYSRPIYIYTIPILLISLSKVIFGTGWQFAFIIFNLVLVLCTLIIFYKILKLLEYQRVRKNLKILESEIARIFELQDFRLDESS